MARPSLASQKKVTAQNLVGLGAERLAEILIEVADTRTDLKRRLRMELAAGLGAIHLVPEIDKRLGLLETSRGVVSWRQKPAFLRDLDAVRGLIAERLGGEEPDAALERLWRFLAAYRQTAARLPDREAGFEAIYERAAGDLGVLLAAHDPHLAANALVEAAAAQPQAWSRWIAPLINGLNAALASKAAPSPAPSPPPLARAALTLAQARALAAPGWSVVIRQLADAAGDVAVYSDSWSAAARATPPVAVEIARRWLAAGQVEAAGDALRLAAPKPKGLRGRLPAPDFDWESVWIDYLAAAGDGAGAQAVRWASFQRTLEIGRAKAYVGQFGDFDDVEAQEQVLAYAAAHEDLERGLAVLIGWPALAEASAAILARGQEARIDPALAEAWAAKLRRRFPAAAERLLRRGAAAAFKQRAFQLSKRLSEEADTVAL